jgi:hypothetical protein
MKMLAVVLSLVLVLGAGVLVGSRFLPIRAAGMAASAGPPRAIAPAEKYPYRGKQFTQFVADSYKEAGAGQPGDFYAWMDRAYERCASRYPGKESLTLQELLDWKRGELSAITDPVKKTQEVTELGAWLHKMVKTTIPRFSLDRGFEFTNTVKLGERQCFLQAVLIAGLLQAMDMDAGMVMVSRNEKGQETNNGHAVTLVKLPDGTDIIVDASDPQPFARQQGLFVEDSGYRYVVPVYQGSSPVIQYYDAVGRKERIAPGRVRTLGSAFVRSQSYYYRGERVPGGIFAKSKTPAGLEASARHLRTSVSLCPGNPLAVYMLGNVYQRQGKTGLARALYADAHRLYSGYGWLPPGPLDRFTRYVRK